MWWRDIPTTQGNLFSSLLRSIVSKIYSKHMFSDVLCGKHLKESKPSLRFLERDRTVVIDQCTSGSVCFFDSIETHYVMYFHVFLHISLQKMQHLNGLEFNLDKEEKETEQKTLAYWITTTVLSLSRNRRDFPCNGSRCFSVREIESTVIVMFVFPACNLVLLLLFSCSVGQICLQHCYLEVPCMKFHSFFDILAFRAWHLNLSLLCWWSVRDIWFFHCYFGVSCVKYESSMVTVAFRAWKQHLLCNFGVPCLKSDFFIVVLQLHSMRGVLSFHCFLVVAGAQFGSSIIIWEVNAWHLILWSTCELSVS